MMHHQSNNNSYEINTYLKTDVDVWLSSLQAGINNRVLISTVQINGRNGITNDILRIKKVAASTLYDSLELSSNTVDKTSIYKVDNIDIVASLESKASASNVYTKEEITDVDIALLVL